MILLIIGVEGVGKSLTARLVSEELRNRGQAVAHLDGETTRVITDNGDFSHQGRARNAWTMGKMACSLHKIGYNVIVSAVFPTIAVRDIFRHACGRRSFWVRLDRTDVDGRQHGVSSVIETFRSDELGINITTSSVADAVEKVIHVIETHCRTSAALTVTGSFYPCDSQAGAQV